MKRFKQVFWEGLKVIVPIGVTFGLIYWICHSLELLFGTIIKALFGSEYYFPGLGLIVGIILVFVIGIFMNAWLGKKIHHIGDKIMKKIPLVKMLYGGVTDLLGFFEQQPTNRGKVVTVNLGSTRLIGIITRENWEMGTAEEAIVYIPMAYNIGGATLLVSREALTPLDISVEEAIRFSMTAGMAMSK